MPVQVESDLIVKLTLYEDSPFYLRLNIAPFVVLHAVLFQFYLNPAILRETARSLLQMTPWPWVVHYNLELDTYGLLALWLLLIACFLHLITIMLGIWNTWIACILEYNEVKNLDEAQYVHAVPPLHCGQDAICELQQKPTGETYFVFQQLNFLFDEERQIFTEISYPDNKALGHYVQSKGIPSRTRVADLEYIYGRNEFDIPAPEFWAVFQEHATAPFFLFQMLTVGLWCMDEYWKYSAFTLCMLIAFECTMVHKRMGNMNMVRNMRAKPYGVWAYRFGIWQRTTTNLLLPGDVISLVRMDEDIVLPCDMFLLSGSVVVNEALLTGESVPQIKEPLNRARPDDPIDPKGIDKASVLYGGTNVVVAKKPDSGFHIPAAADGGALGYVYRTGFATQQGVLLRTILFSTERVSVNNPEAFVFIAILAFFAMFAAGYVLYWGLQDDTRSRFKLALNCIMIVTSVVPPELPMELSLAVNTSLIKLMKNRIFCTEAFRIPFAGGVEFCCFDKTGTLTSDEFHVKGLAGLEKTSATAKRTKDFPGYLEPFSFPLDSQLVVVGCNSLVTIPPMDGNPSKVVGDPLEKAGLKALQWTTDLSEGEACFVSPPKTSSRRITCRVLHRFPFSSALKRMSCIVEVRDTQSYTRIVTKGAAEVIKPRLKQVPKSFDHTCRWFSKQGCRVLAMGWKPFKRSGRQSLRQLSRDEAESDLIFAGFLVLTCPLKKTSVDTIAELRESSHAVMMITGDHMLTAVAVANDVKIVNRPALHLRVDGDTLTWIPLDDEDATSSTASTDSPRKGPMKVTHRIPFSELESEASTARLCLKWDLCLTGRAFKELQRRNEEGSMSDELITRVIRYTRVFARTSPAQKEFIVKSLKAAGICTLMCGDGTNDVGALRQAHCGVALISAPDRRKKSKKQIAAAKKQKEEEEKKRKEEEENMSPAELQKRKWEDMMKKLEEESGGMEMDNKPVKLGDASIASPFTSKVAEIEAVLHIIRQGRCTLVTTLQMYQILALNCTISAYSLSVLYLDGIKFGDTQMTLTGLGVASLFLFVTRSEPRTRLSKQQPRDSIFTWYMFFSMTSQIIVHFVVMFLAVSWSKPHTPTDEETRDPNGKFKPNVLNTVIFLISSIQIVATFAANYIGEPFMQSLQANKGLWRSVCFLSGLCFICASGMFPEFDYWMEIADLPSAEFRNSLLTLMVMDLLVVVGCERICRHLFRKRHNPLIPLN